MKFAKDHSLYTSTVKTYFDAIDSVSSEIQNGLLRISQEARDWPHARMFSATIAAKFASENAEVQKNLLEAMSEFGRDYNPYALGPALESEKRDLVEEAFSRIKRLRPEGLNELREILKTRALPVRADSLVQHLRRWFPDPAEYKEVAQELLIKSLNHHDRFVSGNVFKELYELGQVTPANQALLKSGAIRETSVELEVLERLKPFGVGDPSYYQAAMARGLGHGSTSDVSFNMLMSLPSLEDSTLVEVAKRLEIDSAQMAEANRSRAGRVLKKFIKPDASNLGPATRKVLFAYASEAESLKPQVREFCLDLLGPAAGDRSHQLRFAQNLVRPGFESTAFKALQKSNSLTQETQSLLISHLKAEAQQWPNPDTYPARLLDKFKSSLSHESRAALKELSADEQIRGTFREFASRLSVSSEAAVVRPRTNCIPPLLQRLGSH